MKIGHGAADIHGGGVLSRFQTWIFRGFLAKFAKKSRVETMRTMNISLPERLKAFVDEQVEKRGHGTTSEYVRELIRRDHDRAHLRNLLLEGAASPHSGAADEGWFHELRDRVRRQARE